MSDRTQLYALLAPYLAGAVVLLLAPLLVTAGLSFTQYDVFSPPRWIGLANYQHFFTDRLFQRALYNSLWLGLLGAPLRVAGALALALLLNRPGRGAATVRAAVYLPALLPEMAYALVWLLILNPGFGPLNLALRALGLPGPAWLLTPVLARGVILTMWLFQLGEGFALLLAARQTLPPELFEAAELDGAGRWQRFRWLTLPQMAPALLLLVLRDTALAFQGTFVPGLLTTQTGPYYSTYFLAHYIYDESIGLFKFGYSAAVTMALYGLLAALIGLYYWLGRRWSRPDAD